MAAKQAAEALNDPVRAAYPFSTIDSAILLLYWRKYGHGKKRK
jgi:hypothetical protein